MQTISAQTEPPLAAESTSHPKGLYVLFTTEMWERFSFYGMRAIMKLYMVKALLFSEADSSNLYGSYLGLVYLTPLLGGYIADRYWGNRRSIMVGGLMMALGQFVLFASASSYQNASFAHMAFYIGLALLIFGNGFFKPNISSMVGNLYPPRDRRIDVAYTIFYMGINLGATFAPIVCGYFGDTGRPADFKWGFLLAGIGMLLGTITFELLKGRFIVNADGTPLGARPERRAVQTASESAGNTRNNLLLVALFAGVFALLYFLVLDQKIIDSLIYSAMVVVPIAVLSDKSLTPAERRKINVVLILGFFVIFFWAAFEQAGNSLTTFADKQTDRQLGNFLVPASFFQTINPFGIIIFAPVFAVLWTWLSKRGLEPSSPLKMAYGLALLAVGYLVIAFGVNGATATTKVSMFWLTAMYLLHTFGELCLSPIGLALVNKLAPARLASLMMAVWFLAIATGNKFSGTLGALYPEPGKAAPHFLGFEITGLYEFFMVFVVLCGATAFLLLLIYRKLTKMMADEPTAGVTPVVTA
ncbi:peptide MFS transporter [Hymenobacter convexus]|uniref:peptide MFS transporter n=1 Tax=Hymenobacter sp. CA1UV-4 TaxID=3063782 RepID=UPI0027128FC1|nr:peptide MFS transporter [Hymenobacter sp. CA1UV-4]MDO7852328.1 peptide MFS transporter [Hymenobacter sp. CA1UV-4]